MALINRPAWRDGVQAQATLPQPSRASSNEPQEKVGVAKSVGGFLTGFGKSAIKAAKDYTFGYDVDTFGMSSSVPGILDQNPLVRQLKPLFQRTQLLQDANRFTEERLTPKTTAEEYGSGAFKIAEALAPVPGGQIKTGAGATKLAQSILSKAGIEFLDTLRVTGRQRKEISGEGLREASYSAVLSPLGKVPRAVVGGSQVAQGTGQVLEGDIGGGATNIGIGLATLYGARKQKGLLLDEPISLTRRPQVSADPTNARVSAATPTLPTGRQRLGERIATSVLRPLKSDYDMGLQMKNVAKYDLLKGSLGESLDETQRRIAGYNRIVEETAKKSGDPMVMDVQAAFNRARARFVGEGKSLQSNDYARVIDQAEEGMTGFIPDWRNRRLSVTEALKTQREAGKQALFHHDPISKGDNTLRENFYNALYMELKQELDANLPEQFTKARTALSEIIPVQHLLLRRIPIEERQNLIGLTDSMTTLASIFDPRALAFGAVSRFTKSPTAASLLMRSGKLDAPYIPTEIPTARAFPQLPAPGQIPFRPPTVIPLPPRAQSTMAGRVPPNFKEVKPRTVEEIRFETLQEEAEKVRKMPIFSRVANQSKEIRTLQMDTPDNTPIQSPNLLNTRVPFEVKPTQKDIVKQTAMEVKMLKQQLDDFRFPDEGLEDGYRTFKRMVARDRSILDPDMDAPKFREKFGRKADALINDSTAGGGAYGVYDNDALEAFRMRYETEKRVEAQIARMKQSPATQSFFTPEDTAAFAMAPIAGVEVTYDAEGKPVYGFNAEKSLSGMALGAGFIGGKKALSKRGASLPNKPTKSTSLPAKLANTADANLLAEAKKYKTADEFVKTRGVPVYHGTGSGGFAAFDPKKIGSGIDSQLTGRGDWGQGFYFTENLDDAKSYAKNAGSKPTVVEAYISPQKPLDLRLIKKIEQETRESIKAGGYNIFNAPQELYDAIYKKHGITESTYEKLLDVVKKADDDYFAPSVNKAVKKLGFDALIAPNGEITVFDPSQIKTKAQLLDIWKQANKSN